MPVVIYVYRLRHVLIFRQVKVKISNKLNQKEKRKMGDKDLKQQLEMYKLIYDNLYGGSVVVDARGYITHFSKTYSEYLQIEITYRKFRTF